MLLAAQFELASRKRLVRAMCKPYAPWEDDLITNHYSTFGASYIAERLGRTPAAIRARAGILGARPKVFAWTLREDNILRDCHPNLKRAATLLPNRTRWAIRGRATSLGLSRQKLWTRDQEALLSKATRYCSDVQRAEILGRTPGAIKLRRNELRSLRVPRKESTVPVVRDVVREAKRRGVKLTKLTKALKCGRVDPADDRSPLNFSAVAKVTEAFGGHLYAEWDD